MISFKCDKCGKGYRVADTAANTIVSCKECDEPIRVPTPPELADTVAARERIAAKLAAKQAKAIAKSESVPLAEASPIVRAAVSTTKAVVSRTAGAIVPNDYPHLRRYTGWLRFWGIVINIFCAAAFLITIFGLMFGASITSVVTQVFAILVTSFSANFLFVIAEVVRLMLDAKKELSEILSTQRAILERSMPDGTD